MTTFAEIGLTFNFDSECVTCKDGNCHNVATCKKDGQDYNVHVSTNQDYTDINIYASCSSSNDSVGNIDKDFSSEKEAVNFLCQTFDSFKCF
jgi:hypothetical protein